MCTTNTPTFQQQSFANLMKKDDESSDVNYSQIKKELFKDIFGKVLEIGPGTGVNFKFIPKNCDWMGLEPNRAMYPYLKKAAQLAGFDSITLFGETESIESIEAASLDYVVSTLVLCSVPSVTQVLKDIFRVLKPGGKFIFLEHVVDNKNCVRKAIQKTVVYTPWRYFSDGCNPGRDILNTICQSDFTLLSCTEYHQKGEGMILAINRPHIYGVAQK